MSSKLLRSLIVSLLLLCALHSVGVNAGAGTSRTWKSGRSGRCNSLDAHWNERPGQCVDFLLCPRLLEFAKRPGKTLEDFRVLKKLTCGYTIDKPKICCPDEDIYHPPEPDGNHKYAFQFPVDYDETMNSPFLPSPIEEDLYGHWKLSSGPENPSYARERKKRSLIPNLEDCGEPKQDIITSTRIIGGVKAHPGQFPYMALLFRLDTETDEEENYCAGTIINKFYVLTAGHCIKTNENTTERLAFVQVGVTDITERCMQNHQRECVHDRRYEVEEVLVHPKYVYGSRDRSHDLALIRTTKPISFDRRYIRPICLPYTKHYGISGELIDRSSSLLPSDAGIVAGWGRESNTGPQTSTHLKTTILPILSRSECQRRYAGQVKISENQLCAGGDTGRDTCLGDSGGPLLIPYESLTGVQGRYSGKMFQIGITSFGPALCGKSGKSSVYTKVASYLDWIFESMHI